MSLKFILFLVAITCSIPLQGSVSFSKVNRIQNNRAVYYSQNVHYKMETYSQYNWSKNKALFNDFIDYLPPVEKVKNKKNRYKNRRKKKQKEKI